MPILLAAAASAAAQLPIAPAEPSPTTWAAQARIVYRAGPGLRTINADGSDMRQVTTSDEEPGDLDPAWSPDGERLAFTRYQLGPEHEEDVRVWTARADGSDARPVTAKRNERRYEEDPAWSPDGRELAFVQARESSRGVVTSIVAVNLADGSRRAIHTETSDEDDQSVYLEAPAWSPDGSTVLFTRSTFGGDGQEFAPSLHAVPAAGGAARRLVRDAMHGTWSPDGGRIAYAAIHDRFGERCNDECVAAGEIYVANADGSSPTRLTQSRADDGEPSWSGDGARIVFHSDRNTRQAATEESPREIYSIRPDGSCLTWLTNGTADSHAPAIQSGRGLASEPGGCGPSEREPLIETDTRKLDAFKRFPVWWLGRVAPNGLMLSEAYAGRRLVGLAYEDCARFDPNECGEPVGVTSLDLCASGDHLDVDGGRNRLSLFRGALLHVGGDGASLYTGRTRVELVKLIDGDPGGEDVIDLLRPLRGDRAPGASFPATRLPRSVWREVEQVRTLLRRLGTAAAVGKRLHLRRSVVVQRIKLGRRLAQLGVKRRLGC